MEINKKIIKELKDCLDEFNLNEIEYSFNDTKIKVSKKINSDVQLTSTQVKSKQSFNFLIVFLSISILDHFIN